ncbi:hypothetical protein OHU17_34645 [Streptomyces goshikiensis]|uniref:Uncharacterized protein n=1 Tax=Streptomyces goshikiensis TaxID=1942 RepID=A0ABZ1RUQ3_9ACTN|nr:hypothetical protein [Streptomyces goshikiensis]
MGKGQWFPLPGDMAATLKTRDGSRFSESERLRRPPTGTAFARALEWVDEIGVCRLGRLKPSRGPPNRLAALARYSLGLKAPLLERAAETKRTAMLTAAMRHLEAKAIDGALDLFQILMATRLWNVAKRKADKERLSTLPQLEKASRTLVRAAKALFEECPPGAGPAEGERQAAAAARGGRQAHASRMAV